MSGLEVTVSHPRGRRHKRACGQCRRRKQKCDRERPCGQCSRRFPQPACEYSQASDDDEDYSFLDVTLIPSDDPRPSTVRILQGDHKQPLLLLDKKGADTADQGSTPPRDEQGDFQSSSRFLWGRSSFERAAKWTRNPSVPSHESSLLRFWFESHAHQTGSFDGKPRCINVFVTDFLPFCMESPLLREISKYIAACFLNVTGKVDEGVTMAAKGRAIQMLNNMLRSRSSSSTNEAIAGVSCLINNDLCYGETQHLRLHLGGMREMIQLRGGLASLGLNGLLTKMVLLADLITALTLEEPPLLQDLDLPSEADHAAGERPFILSHLTPLASTASLPAPWPVPEGLDAKTTAVLDDVRFLIEAVLNLPENPAPWEMLKLNSLLNWIDGRISAEPSDPPQPVVVSGTDRPTSVRTASDDSSSSSRPSIPEQKQKQAAGAECAAEQHGEASPTHHLPRRPQGVHPCLHQVIRLAAQVHCRAIRSRQPFSAACARDDVGRLLGLVAQVPLDTWRGVLGVLVWALVAALPTARAMPECFIGKSMAAIASFQMALGSWPTTAEALRRALRLQAWLRTGLAAAEAGESSGDA